MDSYVVEYRFRAGRQEPRCLQLTFDPESFRLMLPPRQDSPPWAALDFHRCPHCPTDIEQAPYCPLALNLVPAVERFGNLISCDSIELEVDIDGKQVYARTSAQRALSSLMGLMIASSQCPYTRFLRPMARFHVPLAGRAETVFRASSTYLLGQFMCQRNGLPADFSLTGLLDRYQKLELLNVWVAKRLRAASWTDASVNAIILLDIYAKAIPMVLATDFESLRPLFSFCLDA